jgi:hypothetical protein
MCLHHYEPDGAAAEDTEMDDSPAYPDSGGDNAEVTGPEPGRQPPPKTPRWVLVLGIIAIALILAVAVQLVFGVRHGPGLH